MTNAPQVPADFKAAIPSTSSSLCGRFKQTFLQLPILVHNIMAYLFNVDGSINSLFLAQIHKAGDLIFSMAPLATGNDRLLCDGTPYSKTTYAALYAAIGDMYATQTNPNYVDANGVPLVISPPPAGFFRVPDFRGMVAMGAPASFPSGKGVVLGSTLGEERHVLVAGEDVPHQHFVANFDNVSGSNTVSGGAGSSGGGNAGTVSTLTATNTLAAGGGHGDVTEAYQLQGDLIADSATAPASVGVTSVSGGGTTTSTFANAKQLVNDNNYYVATGHNNIQPSLGCCVYIATGGISYANATDNPNYND